jgi:hypothetical protein
MLKEISPMGVHLIRRNVADFLVGKGFWDGMTLYGQCHALVLTFANTEDMNEWIEIRNGVMEKMNEDSRK